MFKEPDDTIKLPKLETRDDWEKFIQFAKELKPPNSYFEKADLYAAKDELLKRVRILRDGVVDRTVWTELTTITPEGHTKREIILIMMILHCYKHFPNFQIALFFCIGRMRFTGIRKLFKKIRTLQFIFPKK